MDFRGHLRLPEDAGTGIPVLLRLDDIFVVISSGEDELGTWRADDVVIERIFSNQFAIELDGESMVFVAQDALGFAYDGITAIEDLQQRLTKRRVFKRSKKKPARVEPAAEPAPAADTSPAPASAGTASDEELDGEEWAEESAEEPVLVEPKAIWSPPAASTPRPAQPEDVDEPEFEIAVPEPVLRLVEAEPPVPTPADVRVSYPQPADTAEPPPVADEPREDAPPLPEPQQRSEPAQTDDEPAPADPAPVPSEAPEPAPVAEAPEFEVEEVSAASTGATWADDAMVEVESDEPEIEIEEYVLPSAGAADMFTAPAPQVEDDTPAEPTSRETPEQAVEADLVEPETTAPGDEEPATEEEPADIDDVLPAEGTDLADDAETPPTAEAPAPDAPDAPADDAAASNGHGKSDAGSQGSSKRERRHSLFGRSRDKKVPAHDHQYGDPKTIGGLTRKVCEVCGHVTFSGEDVYQGW